MTGNTAITHALTLLADVTAASHLHTGSTERQTETDTETEKDSR